MSFFIKFLVPRDMVVYWSAVGLSAGMVELGPGSQDKHKVSKRKSNVIIM